MATTIARLDCAEILDWESFHDVFSRVFGFPKFYGRNMSAWIDCMTSLDTAEGGMSTIHCAPGRVVALELTHVREFVGRCPEIYDAIVECSAFVNGRRIEEGKAPVLALSFSE